MYLYLFIIRLNIIITYYLEKYNIYNVLLYLISNKVLIIKFSL